MAAVFQTEMTAAVFQTETSAAALFSTDGLKEAAVFEIVLYDYIGDGVKHELKKCKIVKGSRKKIYFLNYRAIKAFPPPFELFF